MVCKEAQRFISVYIDEEIDEDTRWEFESHIEDCPGCRRELSSIRKTVELARSLDRVLPPADMKVRIQKNIKFIRPAKRRLWPHLIEGLAAAVILFLLIYAYQSLPSRVAEIPKEETEIKAVLKEGPPPRKASQDASKFEPVKRPAAAPDRRGAPTLAKKIVAPRERIALPEGSDLKRRISNISPSITELSESNYTELLSMLESLEETEGGDEVIDFEEEVWTARLAPPQYRSQAHPRIRLIAIEEW